MPNTCGKPKTRENLALIEPRPSWRYATQKATRIIGQYVALSGLVDDEVVVLVEELFNGLHRRIQSRNQERPDPFFGPTTVETGDAHNCVFNDEITSETYPESTERRLWRQSLKKPEGAPLNLG